MKGLQEAQRSYDNREEEMEDWEEAAQEQLSISPEQEEAVEEILTFLEGGSSSYFLLSGAAGTGKTYCIQYLVEQTDRKIVFTAPTNKATKVLRSTLTKEDFKPECRTIYSLLGLKLSPDGAVKKLRVPEDPVDLKDYSTVVVDEASMVSAVLWKEIDKAVQDWGLKVIFLGDKNQLPPVGEQASMVWGEVDLGIELQKVMRFENQILTLANQIKSKISHPAPSIKFQPDNDGIEGVWLEDQREFRAAIIQAARAGDFTDQSRMVKAIAWRNLVVGRLNKLIRAQIFENADEQMWLVGDRIILTGPASEVSSGRGKSSRNLLGHTDTEGVVERTEIARHPDYPEFDCWNLTVTTDENKRIKLWVLHESATNQFKIQQHNLSAMARATPRLWGDFWDFTDAFHKVQHGYAITAHRAQGSTYDSAYVVWNDVLINRNRSEAFRCLYVAATRAKRKLILGQV